MSVSSTSASKCAIDSPLVICFDTLRDKFTQQFDYKVIGESNIQFSLLNLCPVLAGHRKLLRI